MNDVIEEPEVTNKYFRHIPFTRLVYCGGLFYICYCKWYKRLWRWITGG